MRHGFFASALCAVGLSFLAGCGGAGPSVTGTVPEQLEALDVKAGSSASSPQSLGGALTVAGAERDYTLSVDTGSAKTSITVHTPGSSPLAKLAGEAMEIETTEGGFAGPSLFVSDASGPAYLAVFGDGLAISAAEERLGKGFVRSGDEVASETDGTFIWSYRKAVFKTDDGDVTLDPGQVKTLHLGGQTWRAVVIASYQVSTNPDASALPDCSPESLLGFELFRLSDPPATETPLRRLAKLTPAFAGCTPPGGE
ncbi:MAG: hypothetical protein QM820_57940 [Minicystis sp.]